MKTNNVLYIFGLLFLMVRNRSCFTQELLLAQGIAYINDPLVKGSPVSGQSSTLTG